MVRLSQSLLFSTIGSPQRSQAISSAYHPLAVRFSSDQDEFVPQSVSSSNQSPPFFTTDDWDSKEPALASAIYQTLRLLGAHRNMHPETAKQPLSLLLGKRFGELTPFWLRADTEIPLVSRPSELLTAKDDPLAFPPSTDDHALKRQVLHQALTTINFLESRRENPPHWLIQATQKRLQHPSESQSRLTPDQISETLYQLEKHTAHVLLGEATSLGESSPPLWLRNAAELKPSDQHAKVGIVQHRLQQSRQRISSAIEEALHPYEQKILAARVRSLESTEKITQLESDLYQARIHEERQLEVLKKFTTRTAESIRQELQEARNMQQQALESIRGVQHDPAYVETVNELNALWGELPESREDFTHRQRYETKSWAYWHEMGKDLMAPHLGATSVRSMESEDGQIPLASMEDILRRAFRPNFADFPHYLQATKMLEVAQCIDNSEDKDPNEELAGEHTLRALGKAALGLGAYDDSLRNLNNALVGYADYVYHSPTHGKLHRLRLNMAETLSLIAMSESAKDFKAALSEKLGMDSQELQQLYPEPPKHLSFGTAESLPSATLDPVETRLLKDLAHSSVMKTGSAAQRISRTGWIRHMDPAEIKMAEAMMVLEHAYNTTPISTRPWDELAIGYTMAADFFGERAGMIDRFNQDHPKTPFERSAITRNINFSAHFYQKALEEYQALDDLAPRSQAELEAEGKSPAEQWLRQNQKKAMSHMEAVVQGRPRRRYHGEIKTLADAYQKVQTLALKYGMELSKASIQEGSPEDH